MPRALEPIDTQTIHAHLLSRKGVPDGDAFMDNVSLGRVGGGRVWGDVGLDELDDRSGWLSVLCSAGTRVEQDRAEHSGEGEMRDARLLPAVSNMVMPSSIAALI